MRVDQSRGRPTLGGRIDRVDRGRQADDHARYTTSWMAGAYLRRSSAVTMLSNRDGGVGGVHGGQAE